MAEGPSAFPAARPPGCARNPAPDSQPPRPSTQHEYFSGSRVIGIDPGGSAGASLYYANGAVQIILTSVVDALSANPDRRFVVVEQWFFQRWWDAQDDSVQARVRTLVASKQLVFANGGLVSELRASPLRRPTPPPNPLALLPPPRSAR